MDIEVILESIKPYLWGIGAILGGYVVGLIAHAVTWKLYRRFSKYSETNFFKLLNKKWYKPTRYLLITVIMFFALKQVYNNTPALFADISLDTMAVCLLISVIIAAIKLVYVIEETILHHYKVDVKDNLRARQVHTQVRILRRIAIVIIIILAVGGFALSFETFRKLGTGILTSAGIIGLVIGFAAQKILGNLLAGIQIAITQPIRLDDVVIVENEWGRIEEVTLTYVVVRIWDLRRLVLPISYFIEKPFQNWTRVSADILGTVYLYLDYTIPVENIRQKLTEILQKSNNWDKKVNSVQITNTTDKTIEVRALMSAGDASLAWDLRCEVREKLIDFIKENYAKSLPQNRVQLEQDP
jgi:small-conductance mechanosensitive channel